MSDCKLTLGERIADTLLKQGKTQTDLCNEIGMKTSTLNAIITGERKNPRIETIVPIAKGLNTSLDYLLGLSDEPSIDIELKDISLKTGLLSPVVNGLNKSYLGNDGILALNEILMSEYARDFLALCKRYLYYFPSKKVHYVVSTDMFLPPWETKIDDCEYRPISSNEYEKIMLDSITSKIKEIKDNSEGMYKYNMKELDELRKDLKACEDYPSKISNKIIDMSKDYEDNTIVKTHQKFAFTVKESFEKDIKIIEAKINDLEKKIKAYELKHRINN